MMLKQLTPSRVLITRTAPSSLMTAPRASPRLTRNTSRLVAASSSTEQDGSQTLEQAQEALEDFGRRLQPWLEPPVQMMFFPPRAGTGALMSLPSRLQSLEQDIQRARELAQDPRPLVEKQVELLKELEDVVVDFLEKGATMEQDFLDNLKSMLPEQAANLLTELIPEPPYQRTKTGYTQDGNGVQPMVYAGTRYGQDDVMAEQITSEISEIRNAVGGLKGALEAMRVNTEPADAKILMLNLKEARDQLHRRLEEIAPATASDASISAAEREARILLNEVDAMFFS
ncbi:hypothetical protein DUNSADRAFT_9196 [Dunaliella salina]|uniref:Uncharacterized protein n=1 Tax=Dunaliella salina TaxID=3046 RepID=A0ABQ7GI05_DUNSA|nr:hypothetical protein DUNSADRAFT_9196 [Dunaliella salina]|eukprot:KAF5834243.1 hypothetical protein DUNSADRAFT_9196 [Dunaliella salina]